MHLALIIIANLFVYIESSGFRTIEPNGTTHTDKGGTCGKAIANTDDMFKLAQSNSNWRMCIGWGSFSDSSWSGHQSDLFSTFTADHVVPLLYFLSGSNQAIVADWNKNVKTDIMKKRVSYLKADDLNTMKSKHPSACKDMNPIMGYMDTFSQLKDVDPACFSDLLQALSGTRQVNQTTFPITRLHGINEEVLREHAEIIWKYIQDNPDQRMKHLDDEFISRLIMRAPQVCTLMTLAAFADIIKKPSRARVLDKNCLEALESTGILTTAYGKNIKNLPVDLYHYMNMVETHDDFSTFASDEQIANWNDGNDDENSCSRLKLNLLKERLKSVKPKCFHSAYKNGSHRVNLGENYKHVQGDAFSDFKEDELDQVWEVLRDDDLKHMKDTHIKSLIISAKCNLVKPAAINDKRTIDKECFENMTSEVQGAVLSKVRNLPDNLLAGITASQVANWHVVDYSAKKYYYGLQFIASLRNKPKLIPHISESVDNDNDHICSQLKFNDYERFPSDVQNALSKKCLFMINTDNVNLKRIPKKLWGSLSMERMAEAIGKDWSQAKTEDIQALLETHNFCNQASAEIVNQLPEGSIAHIDGDCLSDLPGKDEIVVNIIHKIPPPSFRKLKKNDYVLLKDKMTPEQYGQAGDDINDATQSAANEVTAEDLIAERAAKVTSTFMSHIQKEVYGKLSTSQIQSIQPTSWTKVNKSMTSNIPTPILQSLPPSHISNIGLEIKDKDEDPLSLFTDEMMASMSSEQKQAIHDRKKKVITEEGTEESPSMSTPTIVTIVIVLAVLAAAGGYAIYRHNQA